MFKKNYFILIFSIVISQHSQAALITSKAGYTGPFIDLSAYAGIDYFYTTGPIDLGQISFSANPAVDGNWVPGFSFQGTGYYSLNYEWLYRKYSLCGP